MKIARFLLLFLVTIGLTWFLNTNNPLGTALPPLGKLLNPFDGLWQNTKTDAASSFKDLKLEGLKEGVSVVYDERLVPHIFAQNIEDALFTQGYIHAQHRLWQMDISSRAAGGQLSEVMGSRTLDNDKLMRRRGLGIAAENAVKGWKRSKTYNNVQAYIEGVNTYINSLSPKEYPIEFKLLDYTPTEWTDLKTALFVRLMALRLNFRHHDIAATNSLNIFGQETFDYLFPERNPKQSPIIPRGTAWNFDSTQVALPAAASDAIGHLLPYHQKEMPPEGIGSNNWAVAGSKTASGNPILCNDPHLGLTLPAVWYEIQIHTPEMNVYGVSLPGMPGVTIGFNEDIAWGQTNVGQDVVDWYQMEWANEKKTAYMLDGQSKPVQYRVEQIKVRGGATVIDSVKHTVWGPIVYEDEQSGRKDLAMRWITHDEPKTDEMASFLKLNTAKNYDDYSEALIDYAVPAQNFVFASREGDIAIKVNGDFPIKKQGQGKFVQKGNTSANAWQGIIPKTQVAQIKNPERGFVASANQHSTDDSYPYYYNGPTFDDYRGRILNRKLAEIDNISVEDMMQLQNNNESIFAEEGLSLLLQHLDRSKLNTVQIGLVKILEDWDKQFKNEAVAPMLFMEWYKQFYDLLWDEMAVYKDSIEVLQVEDWRTLQLLEEEPLAVFWDVKDTPERESRTDIVTQGFLKMHENLKDKLDNKDNNWQSYKQLDIRHLTRTIRPFGRYNLPANGFKYSLNANRTIAGPSWRMVVDLGEEIKAYGVYPGGQSGHPSSAHYDDMIDKWAAGEYYELFFMKNADDTRQNRLFTQELGNVK